jgi:hypothetical protein
MVAKHFILLLSILAITSCLNFTQRNTNIDLSKDRNSFIHDIVKHLNNPSISWFGDEVECRNREKYDGPDFFKFFPSLKAILKSESDSVKFWNGCFASNTFSLAKLSKEETVVKINSSDASSRLCKDSYMISTSNIHHIEMKFFKGESTYTFKNLTDDDILEIKTNGFRIFSFCEDLTNTISSIYKTIILFGDKGSGLLPYPINNENEVIDFLHRYTDYKIENRDPKYAHSILDVDENLIQTGDFLPLYEASGLSSLIIYATGSHISHSSVAFRIDGELYVLESENKGVIRTKFREWVQMHHESGYMISWLPLKDEYRKKFNVEKALEWYKLREGLDYGSHNFVFSWFDNVNNNVPLFMDTEILLLLISLVEKFDQKVAQKYFIQGLNHRINTNLKTISEITVAAARQGLTFEKLMAMPERDEWIYDNGENYVCSALVVGIYRAAGLFDDLNINVKEFSPRDIYQLEFFDQEYRDKKPQICKDADPELQFCQIAGKYKMDFKGVGTIKTYNYMNERCESVPPEYKRSEGC